MAYGVHIENPSGQVQIDQDYVNYVLVATSSFYLPYDANPYAYVTGSVIVNNYNPRGDDIICVNTGHRYNLVNCRPADLGYQYLAWGNGVAATVQVKIFRKMSAFNAINSVPALPSNRGYGIDVFTSDGTTLAYTSYYAPMRIAGVISGNPPMSTSGFTISSGTPFISSNTGFVLAASDPPDGPFSGISEYQMVSADATKAYAEFGEILGEYAPAAYSYPGTVSMLVVQG